MIQNIKEYAFSFSLGLFKNIKIFQKLKMQRFFHKGAKLLAKILNLLDEKLKEINKSHI